MSRYRVCHNATKMEFFDSYSEVEGYIAKVLEEYKSLTPKEIYRGYGTDNKAPDETYGGRGTIKSVVIWQYRTLYTEVFMIEEIK